MADLFATWKDDLQVDPTGDLLLVEGSDETEQRIIRRLLTATRGYIWHLTYGAGLPERIGKVALPARIQSICQAQILLESTVARVPGPKVTVTESTVDLGLFVIDVDYTDAATGEALSLSFDVPTR